MNDYALPCEQCGVGPADPKLIIDHEFEYHSQITGNTEIARVDLPVFSCDACKFEYYGEAGTDAIAIAIKHNEELLKSILRK